MHTDSELNHVNEDSNVVFIDPADTNNDGLLSDTRVTGILDRINSRIGVSADSPHDVLKFVFSETRSLFHCNRLGLAFLTDGNERVAAHTAVADYEPVYLKKGYSEDLRGSSLEHILQTGKTRIIKDLGLYLKAHPESRSTSIICKEGMRSSMTCPLRVDDRIVGLFFRSSSRPDAYTRDHVGYHIAIADRLSQVVEKAYRIEQLTETMKNYREMLGFVSHEIKSPVAATIMESRLILDNYLGDVPPKIRDRVERIVKRNELLLGMVKEYLDISRIEDGELAITLQKNVDITETVIRQIIDVLQANAESKKMAIRLDVGNAPLRIDCDPDLLRIAFSNLLSNAIKYGNEDTEVLVEVGQEADRLIVSVTNEGAGFSKSDMPMLFRKFSRLQAPNLLKQKGTGLGLYTVWRIMKLHSGSVRAESEQGKWARFSLDLPVESS